jgi:hypothetical protein
VSKAVDSVNKAEGNFNKGVTDLEDTCHSLVDLSDALLALVQKIDAVNFPERLDNIQATVEDTIKNLNGIKEATLTEVQKAANTITRADFEGKFSSLQKEIDTSVKSNQALADGIDKMKIPEKIDEFEKSISQHISESYKKIERNTKQIADDTSKAILNLNLPIRIDKLDANIAGISSAIQNIHSRLDGIERSIIEKIKDYAEKHLSTLSANTERVISDNSKIRKASKTNFVITWLIILFAFVAFYFLLTK